MSEKKFIVVWHDGNQDQIKEAMGNTVSDAIFNSGLQDAAEQCNIVAVIQVPAATEYWSFGPAEYSGSEFPLALIEGEG